MALVLPIPRRSLTLTEDADESEAAAAEQRMAWERVSDRLAGAFARIAAESETEAEEEDEPQEARRPCAREQVVDAGAWRQVGRRIAGAITAAAEESEPEAEEELAAEADPAAWREVASRMAALFAAAADGDSDDDLKWEAEALAATKAGKPAVLATPAPTVTTAPGSAAPSDRSFDDEGDCSDGEDDGADAEPAFPKQAFSVLLSMRLDAEAPLSCSSGAVGRGTAAEEKVPALRNLAGRLAGRFAEAQAELEAECW